jgi:hypothetical protein
LSIVAASPAAAYEDKITLGAGAGYALAPASSEGASGIAFDLHGGLGIGVEWQLRAGLSYAYHPVETSAAHFGLARTELVYLIDIVDIVPFGGIGVGACIVDAMRPSGPVAGPHAVLGVAYWISFDALLELDVRAHLFPELASDDVVYLVSALSLVWAFDR